jgi:phosphate uptake regulator
MQTMEMESGSTDKRIDDLNARMSEGFQRVHREIDGLDKRMTESFRRVDREIAGLDKRMTEGFKRVDADIRELRGDVKSLDARFDAMHRTMMRGFFALGGITVTLFLALAGMQGL